MRRLVAAAMQCPVGGSVEVRVGRRWCTVTIVKNDEAKQVESVKRPTSSLYDAEVEKQGGFRSAMVAVNQRREKKDELLATPEFLENQLGRVADSYTLIRGDQKDGNLEQSILLKDSRVMPGIVLACFIVFGSITMYFSFKNEEKTYAKSFNQRNEGMGYVGTPKLGGPFSLKNCKTNEVVTSESLKGKWLYIYFGFTNCPDICPDQMKKLSFVTERMQAIMGPEAFQPVFITVDAKRDSNEAVAEYLKDYHPAILGLTGTEQEVEVATRAYRVFHAVPDVDTFTEDDYLIDHSIISYLMDPEGQFAEYTTRDYNTVESTHKIRSAIKNWEDEQVKKGLLDASKRNRDLSLVNIVGTM